MAENTNINVNSQETHISVNALQRGLANTAGDGANAQKLDDAVKIVLKGDLPIIKDTFELIQGYTAAVTGSILGYDGMTLTKTFDNLKSQIKTSPLNNLKNIGDVVNNTKNINGNLETINSNISAFYELCLKQLLKIDETISDNFNNLLTTIIENNTTDNVSSKSSDDIKAKLDIIVYGLDKDGLNSLAKLASTDVSAKSIFGDTVDLAGFVESIKKINSFSKASKNLNLSWITPELINGLGLLGNFLNSLSDVLITVPNIGPRLWIMNKLLKEKQIKDAVASFKKFQGFSKIDFSWITNEFVTGFKNVNEFIYALDEIDIDQFVETIKRFETFNALVEQDFDWLDDKKVINRMKVVTMISDYLTVIIGNISSSVKKHVLISEFAWEIKHTWETLLYITTIIPGVLKNLADLDEKNIKQAIKTVELLNDLTFYVSIGVIEAAFAAIGVKRYIKFIKKIGDKKDSLVEAVNQLPGMKSYAKKVMSIEDVFHSLSSIAKSAAIMAVMIIPAQLGLLMTTWFLKGVTKTIKSINEAVNPEELKGGFDKIKDFAKLLLTIGGVVIFAGLIGVFLAKHIGAILSFSVILCVFMSGVILAVSVGTKLIKGAIDQVGKFSKLLLVSSLLLVFGAFAGEWIRDNFVNILCFTGTLALFIIAICGIYSLASRWIKSALPDTKNLMLLVVGSAAILLIGSLIVKYINIGDLIMFPLILSLFIGAILGVYTVASFFIPKVDKTAKNFQLIVITSALTLIIGALFMKTDGFWQNAVGFGVIVAAFILAVTTAYKLGAKGITASLNAAEKFSVLVAVSALVLIVAAKLLTDKWEYFRILAFGVLLAAFVWLVTLAFARNANDIKKSLMPALGLALIVAVSGAVLILAGKLLTKDDIWGVLFFSIILLGFTFIMIWICDSLSKKIGAIYKSIFAMAGIAIVIMLTGLAFQECAEAYKAFGGGWKGAGKMVICIGIMAVAVAGLLAIAAVAGQPQFAAAIAIGEIVMAGMVVIMWGTAKAMQAAAAAMDDMIEVSKKAKDFESKSIVSLITGFLSIVGALSPLANPITTVTLGLAAGTLYGLAKAINQMAITSKNIASLNIPIYNGTKVVGYTKMTPKDFEVAAMNAKTIITTLSRAIAQAHDENPEMFETNMFGRSKFRNTVKACTGLASMLSKIARSVQDYASLNVPEYSADGKKVIRRRPLNSKDFKDAAKNVKKVIMTLGQAIISTYESAPEMFETSGGMFGFGAKSKFGKVVNACSSLGELVSDIANGIKTYADLNIPIAWNSEGKPVKFKAMTDEDFKKAAETVKAVMTTLGGAIIEAYDKSPYMFETTGGILGFGAQSKFTKVMKSYSALGGLISDISAGVKSYAYLNIPTKWNNEGKPIAFEQIADKTAFFTEATTNIKNVLTTIGGAIIDTFNDKKEWYESSGGIFGFGESTPFGRVIKASMGMGKMISYIAQGIKDYYSMAIPTGFDKDGKATGYIQFNGETDFKVAGDKIGDVISTLGNSIITAYDEHKEWFDDDSWFGKGSSTSKFYRVITACSGMGRMISNIANAVRNFANLTIDDPKEGKRQMKREDFKNANLCIGSVIRTMGWALMKAFGEHPEWFEDKSWFSNKPENTKFGMIMAATKGMGEMISNAAQAVVNVANLRFKDENDKEIIMTDEHITKAGEKTQQIFEAIFNAIEKTYDIHKEKGKALSEDGEIIKAIKDGSANVMGAIKSSIAAINQINGLKVSTESLKQGDGNTVRDKMDAILNMLPASIEASSKNWNKENEEKAKQIIDHSETYNAAYSKVATIFNTMANILQPDKVSVFKANYDGNGTNTLRDILEGIFASTAGLRFTRAKDLSRITSSLQKSSQLFMSVSDIFEELVDEIYNNKEFNKAYNIITNDENKNKLKNSLSLLSEAFNSIKFSWIDPHLDKNFKICMNAMHSISSIYNILSSITNTRGFGFSQVEMENLFTPIRRLLTNMYLEKNLVERAIFFNENQKIIRKTVEGIAEIESTALHIKPSAFILFPLMINAYINALQKMGGKTAENIDFEVIAKTQDKYLLIRNIVNDLVSINSAMANGGDFSSIKTFPVVAESYKSGLITMCEAYQALNKIGGSSTSMFDNLFNSLYGSENQEQDVFSKALQGINSVIEKISQESLDKFHKQTKDVTDFTKAINSVDLAKVNSLTDLTDSLNQLAASMGNLDGLTEAIAVKLAAVLDKLTAELRVTKDTFATAERIQKQRNEFVNKAITRVENTMKNPLVVRVGLEETEENSTSTTSGNNKDRGTSGGGGGSTVTSPGNPVGLQTPESTSTPADNQFNKNKTPGENTSKAKKYEVNGVKTQASQNNFGNITSTIRTTVRSVFEEMIYKYNLDGNTARGNARPS